MKITLLGTGSLEPSTRRASSGYLVSIGTETILLDCGGGVFDRLLQAGYLPADVTHLFFTHLHSDHMMDYARLVHAAWDSGALHTDAQHTDSMHTCGSPLQVAGPAPFEAITNKLFGRDGVFASDLLARTEHPAGQEIWTSRRGSLPRAWPAPAVTEIKPGYVHESPNGWTLTSCRVPHAQPQMECMAFRIDYKGKSFVYSGDAALCRELELLANDCDVLLHWCYRLHRDRALPAVEMMSPDPVDIAQLATRCGVSRLIVTHLRNRMDTDVAHTQILNDLNQHFTDETVIAEDLMVVEI